MLVLVLVGLNTDCSNRARVVFPLDDGPDIPIIIALSDIVLVIDCVQCTE